MQYPGVLWEQLEMKIQKYVLTNRLSWLVGLTFLLLGAGCNRSDRLLQHKLVATGGQHTVAMYPDEQTFLKVASKAQEGGVSGALGNVQKQFTAKQIEDQTAVRIISSDSNGALVEITDGPLKGQTGFVAPQNIS
jgi:hypothetical protein